MRTSITRSLAAAIVLLNTAAVARAQVTPSFVPLGDLPGGDSYSEALGVTPDGEHVVGVSSSHMGPPGDVEAFRWTAGLGMIGLGYPLPGYSLGTGISADGAVVVGYQTKDDGWEAFRWTLHQGRVPLTGIPTGYSSFAEAVSADGNVVVGYLSNNSSSGFWAFRWTAATGPVLLLPDYAGGSVATGLSADGRVVIGYTLDGTPFRWTAQSGALTLGEPPRGYVVDAATAISADGTTIVGSLRNTRDDARCQAYRWTTARGFTLLTGQSKTGRWCYRANAVAVYGVLVSGSEVLVDAAGNVLEDDTFVWTERKGVKPFQAILDANPGIDLNGWALGINMIATDPNANAFAIAGTGIDPEGFIEGWLAVMPAVQGVPIDIRPDSRSNEINLKSQGKVTVAVLSTRSFDAVARMDRSSLRFGRTGIESSLASCDDFPADVNGDGFRDLVCRFEIARTAFTCNDTRGVLTGEAKDGNPLLGVFGLDSIQPYGCKGN